ncbi:GAF domain-containing protein [Plantibacter sp. CFBP 8798]|uniref:GAF domain-containing protein n=1 Tax=Plantibacter sp. CFBP 8798 TaxID=2775268 RepID=UPI002017EF8F|nr:GAF domain-containing protein [Plantibacter sp. CFBP 8798]
MDDAREARLIETFVTLTDSLVDNYDVVELLQILVDRAVELFDAAAGAIHLADRDGDLRVVASTSERSSFFGLLQLNAGEGPCIAAVTSGHLVTVETADELHPTGRGSRRPRTRAGTSAFMRSRCASATPSSGR